MGVAFRIAAAVLLCSAPVVAPAQQRSPAEVSITSVSPEQAESIDDLIRREMNARHIAGAALAVTHRGRVLYAQGYGLADVSAGTPVKPETRFLVASITKMFTAVATMMLGQDGKLSLDAPAGEMLPDLPEAWRKVTPRQLLTHTAGVPSYSRFGTLQCPRMKAEADYAAPDVIHEVACLPLEFVPGSDFSYSDTGYHLLGLLIEQASGRTYEAFLRERILLPLGMHNTRLMKRPDEADDRAVGYRWEAGKFHTGPRLYPMVEMSTGGLTSNVFDLARFDAALTGDKLLPQQVLHRMWMPSGVGSARYGMGFAALPIGERQQVGHTGGGPAASTSFARFNNGDLTVILLTNTGQPPLSIQSIVGPVADIVSGPPFDGGGPGERG